jgi:acyl-coenzyme A synthetase/AMP-(fatty) acid ligase
LDLTTGAATPLHSGRGQLLHEVKRVAAALRGLGLAQGDRITIYMPPTAMTAVTRTLRK